MFNVNLNYAACPDDEHLLIAELIHERNKLSACGDCSPELDTLLKAVKNRGFEEKNGIKKNRTVKKSGDSRGLLGRIKLLIPIRRAHSKLL